MVTGQRLIFCICIQTLVGITAGYAQSNLALSSATAAGGATVALNLSVSSPSGSEPAGLQWTLAYPTASVTALSVVPAASSTAAGKSISCNSQAGAYTCVVSGTTGKIANGVVATVTATLAAAASNASIAVNVTSAVDPAGTALAATGTAGTITITSTTTPVPVSLTSLSCAPASVGPGASSTCTIALSAPAPSGGAVVGLTASSVSVPASVTVPANASSTTFNATAGAFTTSQTATVTASLNGSSKSAAISLVVAPTSAPSVTSLTCAPSTLTASSTSSCTVTLSAAAGSGGVVVTLASTSPALKVPASVTIAAKATSATFTATAGSFTAAASAVISATSGASSVSAPISLVLAPSSSGATLLITGAASEAASTVNGARVTPTVAPSGFSGKLVRNGTGAVTFAPAGGVSFTNCCNNTNNAYYNFSGAAVGTMFNGSQTQISFSLTSRYSFADRQALASAARYAFDARDGNGTHQYQFYTQTLSGNLVFYYVVGGSLQYYYAPKGTEDTLFGKGVTMAVTLQWDGKTATLLLNGKSVRSAPYVAANANWNASSILDLGATEYKTFGGYNSLDDTIAQFSLAAPAALQTPIVAPITALAAPTAAPLIATDAAPAAAGASLACAPKAIGPGSTAVCDLRLRAAGPDAITAIITARSENLHVPAVLLFRPGQTVARFEVAAADEMPQGDTLLEATLGGASLQETLAVTQPEGPALRAPRTLRATVGTSLRFDVVAAGGSGEMLSVSDAPAGSVFDALTGSFAWTPASGDLGVHRIGFVASNSLGRSTTKTVEVTVEEATAQSGPQILTVGDDDSDQAFAVHADTSTLAAIPSARFDGQPVRGGDVIWIYATGLDCGTATIPSVLARFGRLIAPVLSAEPVADAPSVCRVGVQTPAGVEGPQTALRLDIVSAAGVRAGNTVTIAVE